MNMKKVFIWGGVLALVGGIVLWVKYQSELASKLVYSMKNAKLRKINANQILADFDFEVKNPTELTINIDSIDIDVYGNDVLLTNIKSKKESFVLKNSTTLIPLVLDVNPTLLSKNSFELINLATNLKATRLTFRGKIKVRKFGLVIPVPFIYNTTYGELMG